MRIFIFVDITPILFVAAVLYSILLIIVFICGIELKSRHLYHCTYRLFTFSVMTHWIGIICQGITWTKYAITGVSPNRILGELLVGVSEISFLLLIMLMGKGYTITKARLTTCTTIKLTVLVNAYIVLFISLYIYQAEVRWVFLINSFIQY